MHVEEGNTKISANWATFDKAGYKDNLCLIIREHATQNLKNQKLCKLI